MRRAWPPRGWRPLVCYRAGREAHGGDLPTRLAILVPSTPSANPRVGLPRRFALAAHAARTPSTVDAIRKPTRRPPAAIRARRSRRQLRIQPLHAVVQPIERVDVRLRRRDDDVGVRTQPVDD